MENQTIKAAIVALASLYLFASCNNSTNTTDNKATSTTEKNAVETILTGQITNILASEMILSSDNFSDTVSLNPANQFTFNWKLANDGYFVLRNGNRTVHLFISPGDELHLEYDNHDILNSITFTGKHSEANQYLKQKYQLMVAHNLAGSHLYELPVKEFRYLADSLYVTEKLVFESYQKQHPALTQTFVQMEQASLLYDWATKLMEYPRLSPQANTIDGTTYFNFLQKLDVNNSTLLPLCEYKIFLNAYIAWHAEEHIKKLADQNLEPHEMTLFRLQQVNSQIKNQTVKNFLLGSMVKEQVKYFGYKNCEWVFKTFEANCTDGLLKEQLLAPYLKYQALETSGTAPEVSFEDMEGAKSGLNRFLGSYIYIDVWATWCLPCKRESPFFEELGQKYAHKNIQFISLSVDNKKEDWSSFLQVKGTSRNQYWVENAELFLKDYQIKTIPRFIIIDPQGKIIQVDAFRPSEPDLSWFNQLPDKPQV